MLRWVLSFKFCKEKINENCFSCNILLYFFNFSFYCIYEDDSVNRYCFVGPIQIYRTYSTAVFAKKNSQKKNFHKIVDFHLYFAEIFCGIVNIKNILYWTALHCTEALFLDVVMTGTVCPSNAPSKRQCFMSTYIQMFASYKYRHIYINIGLDSSLGVMTYHGYVQNQGLCTALNCTVLYALYCTVQLFLFELPQQLRDKENNLGIPCAPSSLPRSPAVFPTSEPPAVNR